MKVLSGEARHLIDLEPRTLDRLKAELLEHLKHSYGHSLMFKPHDNCIRNLRADCIVVELMKEIRELEKVK